MECPKCPDTNVHMHADDLGVPEQHPSSQRFHDILYKLGRLHNRKQRDYGTDEDPFNNIRASAKEWGVRPWVAALMRAGDKARRLQRFAETGTLANEGVLDAFDDDAVYIVIARVLYEEEESPYYPDPEEVGCQINLVDGMHFGKCMGSCKDD
jgi:hypothetical protein